MKFQFNHSENKLILITANNWGGETHQEIPASQFFLTNYGGSGWQLDPNNSAHWINFTVFSTKINVFYKKPVSSDLLSNEFIYYKKEFPKAEVITREFSVADEVIKNEQNHWVFKNKS